MSVLAAAMLIALPAGSPGAGPRRVALEWGSPTSRDACRMCTPTLNDLWLDGGRSSDEREDAVSMSGITCYVDAVGGSDDNAGTSPEHAWKSLRRVSRSRPGPGARILLAGGQVFPGTLRLSKLSGSEEAPIVVSSFRHGRSTIDGRRGDGIVLTDCDYVTVRDLRVVGCGRDDGSEGAGVTLLRTAHVVLDGLDVSGFRVAGVSAGGDVGTRITSIRSHDNGSAGISVNGGYEDVPRSRDLYIGDCVVYNNPGDPRNLGNHSGNGIVVGGLDGGLIEYCEAFNNGWDMPRTGNGPVGIWGWNCDRLTIQCCVSHDNKSPGDDGGGFDFDGGVTNSTMQYNLSYGNEGTGYLLCQYPGAPEWRGNVVRYNISINDGSRSFHRGIGLWLGDTGISDALIYNNTIVNPVHAVVTKGDLPGFVYRNNVFVAGQAPLDGPFASSRFERNLYWRPGPGLFCRDGEAERATLDDWAKATGQEIVHDRLVGLWADPMLVMPAPGDKLPSDPLDLAAMPFGRPRLGSPCVGAGMRVPDNGGRDAFGNHVAVTGRPSLGACEIPFER